MSWNVMKVIYLFFNRHLFINKCKNVHIKKKYLSLLSVNSLLEKKPKQLNTILNNKKL